jgi:hypothetical protein
MLPWRRRRIGASQTEGGEGEMEGVRAAKVLEGWGKNFIREHETLALHRTAAICLGRDERISARYEIGNFLGPW